MVRSDSSEEFYVGYLDQAPPRTLGFVRRVVTLAVLAALGVVVVVASEQRAFSGSQFEFGTVREFEGVVGEGPLPTLYVPRPGVTGEHATHSSYALTVFGKKGAGERVAEFAGRKVRLHGTLIHLEEQTMLELSGDPIEDLGPAEVSLPLVVDQGAATLRGEIVDSKCYLGVMKPALGKAHRACAIRCISGGVPPLFVARDERGEVRHLYLLGRDGRALNMEILDLVALPVEVHGELRTEGERWFLHADPADFEVVGED